MLGDSPSVVQLTSDLLSPGCWAGQQPLSSPTDPRPAVSRLMRWVTVAIGCTYRLGDKPGMCFYRIPSEKENKERRRLWICALRRASVPGEDKQCQPSKYTCLFSEHFIKGEVKLVSQHSILIIVLCGIPPLKPRPRRGRGLGGSRRPYRT